MNDKDIQALKALAEAATQEEWLRDGRTVYALQHAGWKKGEEQFENRFFCGVQHGRGTPESELEANAAFIVAAQPRAILSLLSRIEQQAARIAELESKRPAVDLSGLTRYAMIGTLMNPHTSGAYYRVEEVQSIFAAHARDRGDIPSLNDCRQLIDDGSIGSLLLKQAEREVLATKEAEPIASAVYVRGEEKPRIYQSETVAHALAQRNSATVRPLVHAPATSPAPSVKQEPMHDSDCSLHNAPALPVGPCDCSLAAPSASHGEVNDWISVEDRLPVDGETVLAWVGDQVVIERWMERHESLVGWNSATMPIGPAWDEHEFEEITHWMPLPAAPAPSVTDGGEHA